MRVVETGRAVMIRGGGRCLVDGDPATTRQVRHEKGRLPGRRVEGRPSLVVVIRKGLWLSELDLSLELRFDALERQILPRPAHLELRNLEPALQHSRDLISCQHASRAAS